MTDVETLKVGDTITAPSGTVWTFEGQGSYAWGGTKFWAFRSGGGKARRLYRQEVEALLRTKVMGR